MAGEIEVSFPSLKTQQRTAQKLGKKKKTSEGKNPTALVHSELGRELL